MSTNSFQLDKEITNNPLVGKNSKHKRSRHKGKGTSQRGEAMGTLCQYNIKPDNIDQPTTWEDNRKNSSHTLEQFEANKRHVPTQNTFELLARLEDLPKNSRLGEDIVSEPDMRESDNES